VFSSEYSSQTDVFDLEDDPLDLTYEPSSSQVSTQLSSQSSQSRSSLMDDWKFIVFESHLDILFSLLVCPTCECACCVDDVIKESDNGSILRAVVYCTRGHVIIK
jgi:hypothetical protein